MVIYTTEGLRKISRIFDLYEDDPTALNWNDLGLVRDHIKAEESRWLDLAYIIADRLNCQPTFLEMVTEDTIDRCRSAYSKWIAGNARPSDMPDAMLYCTIQADLWSDELEILNQFIKAKAET